MSEERRKRFLAKRAAWSQFWLRSKVQLLSYSQDSYRSYEIIALALIHLFQGLIYIFFSQSQAGSLWGCCCLEHGWSLHSQDRAQGSGCSRVAAASLTARTQAGLLNHSSLLTASLEMCHRNNSVAHQREALLSLFHNPLILFLIRP